ncbi:MAG: tRNA (guanosine(37)-N1)-methyltransferase TrmD [Bacteroidales bacterium]|nr:tRNA (guanosine(37)-N1)-methyltransferase TrmD [Bacteroidales bacterium]MDD3911006.1 tRNA (guanosine(37)-N1)-methyltransferase TrmD [Bacteroidales bacterium]MDD4420425.1 tRNA (guanosine(37)-N1)-methyltransferase TrmD [Bacteroidales bacterium]
MARAIISVEDKKKRVAKSAAKKKNASARKSAAKKHHLRIDILTAVPELLNSPLNFSIVERAKKKGLVRIFIHNIRDYAKGKYKKVDDYSYGGEAGMVMMIEPIYTLITKLKKQRKYDEIIYLTPDGEIFNQQIANQLSLKKNIILLCGHYKGIDHRIREHLITMEISIGDYVLSGGEIAAAAISDTIIRLLPGALSDETSALSDSFQDNLLSAPIYTRPADFKGWKVPEILLSGNHDKIAQWNDEQSLARTKKLRPDLLK